MTILIERLGHRGDGIAAGPVYAARTLPGETVDGERDGDRILSPKIVQPSPDRVAAPCQHYRSCGGCALMHASDSFVAGWKTDMVHAALTAQGVTAPVGEISTSPSGTRRRAAFTGRRLKSGPVVGFHARASDTVVPVPGCKVLDPTLVDVLPALREITARFGSRKGALRFLATASQAGVDVAIGGGTTPDGEGRLALAALANASDLARVSYDGDVIVERRPPVQRFDAVSAVPPPGAFLQATPQGEAALRDAVRDAVGSASQVADLFAGCGTFALPLALGADVHAVEGDADMLLELDRAWRHGAGLKRVTTETRDLFRRPLEPDELNRYDAVVIDPPRAGAEAQMRALGASTVDRIAAVSCNPISFARDARILTRAGYRLTSLQIVDQFRWSAHIELVAAFRRDHMARGK
ncbi:MAG: class I SAM-dependent RNA methyltransferase [Pseudomonadota bacterium]